VRATRLTTASLIAAGAACFVAVHFQTPVTALAGAAACADIAALVVPGATITSATEVRDPFTVDGNGRNTLTVSAPFPFCRVALRLAPSADSDIHAEVWLPAADKWNGRFLGVGNGGLSGNIWFTSMIRPLQRGYAVAGSDLGHTAPNADWALGHPEKFVDYAHRADHVTAVAAKAIVAAHYGQGPRYAYFHGCSNGGHQALMEAQQYPDDYNAIIAGAPWNNWTDQVVEFAWRTQQVERIDKTKLPLITKAVVAQCGGRDGGAAGDQYLNDPRVCQFDPKVLQCKGADGATCLTPAEVDAVQKVYAGPSQNNRRLFPGFEPGSESAWTPGVGSFTTNLYRSLVYPSNTTWDVHNFNFSDDVVAIHKTVGSLIDSNRTDMNRFRSRGGKILMWHGWTDTTLEPRESIRYYNRVVAANAAAAKGSDPDRAQLTDTQAYFRLFMAPGVNHCGGGLGPGSTFAYTMNNAEGLVDPEHDALAALERWVETGTAPETFATSHMTDGKVDRTRLLCTYPKVARYRGTGDVNVPASFTCEDDWAGFKRDRAEAIK
jgi:tannase/feruloyl esterase